MPEPARSEHHLQSTRLFRTDLLYGIATGSDTQTWWGVLIYISSVALVGGLLLSRLLSPVNACSRSHPVIATLVGLLPLVGVI